MSDEILSELLARSVEGVPVADPPVDSLVRRGRAARLRRRRTAVLGAALACLLVIGGAGLARQLTHSDPSSAAGPSQPPAGTKWVGIGRTVVSVPAAWPVIPGLACPGPDRPYVTTISAEEMSHAYTCSPLAPQGIPHVTITPVGAHAQGTADGPSATLPSGWRAVPGRPDSSGFLSVASETAALEAAGFRADVEPAVLGSIWLPVTTSPEIGAPARLGSTVVVYDHSALPSTATLNGQLRWVGGPGGASVPHYGTIHVVNADRSFDQYARVEKDLMWSLDLPAGTYQVLGTSPGYLSRQGQRDACSADGSVTVTDGQTITADVYCQLM